VIWSPRLDVLDHITDQWQLTVRLSKSSSLDGLTLLKSSPHLLTCCCSRESFFPVRRTVRCYRWWSARARKAGEVQGELYTGISRTCRQSLLDPREACADSACVICWALPTSACSSHLTGRDIPPRLHCWRFRTADECDDKQVTVLIGLDMLVAFDTVNHDIAWTLEQQISAL